ncbi:MAG: hypothetical protein M3N52_07190 [Actinomycetota bacterium]|nr:hypothetical protein [Actinomycetota bacterium]
MADPRREPVREPPREREVVVTRGGGPWGIIAAIVAVIVVLIIGYFVVQAMQTSDTPEANVPQVNVPDEVQVDVNTE